jgi:polyhydroxyalkanoate synthesis regulator protein
MIHITQYRNHKLYIAAESRYTNLGEIKDFIQSGKNVQVIYKPTGEDITAFILSQVLTLTKGLSAGALRELIIKGH